MRRDSLELRRVLPRAPPPDAFPRGGPRASSRASGAPPRARRPARHGAVRERVAQLAGPTHAVAVALRIRARDDAGAFDADPPANQRYDIADRAGVRPRASEVASEVASLDLPHTPRRRELRVEARQAGRAPPTQRGERAEHHPEPDERHDRDEGGLVEFAVPLRCGAAGAFPAPHNATRGRGVDAREEDARRDRERRRTETHPRRLARGGLVRPTRAFRLSRGARFFFFTRRLSETLRDAPPAYTPRRA